MNGYPYPPMMQVPYGYTNAVPMVPSAMGPGISTTTSMGVEYPQPSSVIPVQYVPSVSTPLPPGFLPGVPYQQQPAVQGTLSNVYPQQQLPMQPMAAQQYAQQQWYTQQQQQQQQMYAQQQQQIYTQQQQQQQMYAQQQQQQQQQIYAQQQQQQWYAQQQQLQQNQQIYGSHMAPQALNNTTTASTSSYQICNPAAANPVLSPGTCAPVANTCQEGVFKVADATTVVNSGEPVMGVVLETAHSNTHNTSAPSNKVAIKQQPQQIPTPANRPGLPAVLPDGRSLCPQGKMCPAQYNTNHKKLFYHGPEGHLAGYLDPDTFFS